MGGPFFSLFSEDFSTYRLDDIKEVGFVIDWFSNVYDRTILVGHVVYETHKNYRCKKELEQYKINNAMSIPTVIFIHDLNKDALLKFKTVENLFVNKVKEVEDVNYRIICTFKQPKRKRNGKPIKRYDIDRKKRFTIPVDHILITNGKRLVKSTVISCTFRNLT
jgi:hypothetical protein